MCVVCCFSWLVWTWAKSPVALKKRFLFPSQPRTLTLAAHTLYWINMALEFTRGPMQMRLEGISLVVQPSMNTCSTHDKVQHEQVCSCGYCGVLFE